MSQPVKFLIGLVAVLVLGWVYHGPLGHGQAFIDRLEGQARTAVERTDVKGVEVRLGRDPLSRTALLSGPADSFQREGRGSLKGINDHVAEVEGIAGLEWANPPTAGGPR